MLAQLHKGHSGMALAHMYVWWSGITGDSECAVSDCAECQCNQSQPAVALLCLWNWPMHPWARLHIDYAGPVDGRMFLIVIDAHSNGLRHSAHQQPLRKL